MTTGIQPPAKPKIKKNHAASENSVQSSVDGTLNSVDNPEHERKFLRQFALGLIDESELVELDHYGYMPMRADVIIPPDCREAMKRLALTLDAKEARLSDGTLTKCSIPKAIMWMIEQFSESLENRNSGKPES